VEPALGWLQELVSPLGLAAVLASLVLLARRSALGPALALRVALALRLVMLLKLASPSARERLLPSVSLPER
jgi:hypothetical protein